MGMLRWLRRHPILVIIVVVALIPITLGVHWWFWPSIPDVSMDEVASVEVHLIAWQNDDDPDNRQIEAKVATTDPDKIKALFSVLSGASRASEHKCGDSGTITIRRKDGETEELGILPGHKREFYEYRFDGRINRVDRERFLAAMKGIGVQQIKLSSP